jgi:phage gp29-like protein
MEEKDAHLASVLQTRKQAVVGLDWSILPYSADAKDQEIAEFCDEAIRQTALFEEAQLDLLDAIGKGYAAAEIIWTYDGGRVRPERLDWIHPKRISLYDSLTPRILTDTDLLRGIEPPPWKIIYHRYRSRSGHDSRAGVLRVCAWMYLFKNYAIKDWAVFAEVFGMPLRLGKYEPSASQADKDALVTALKSLGTDAAGIISKATEIEFVEASQRLSGNSNPYDLLAGFCNREISKAVLGQTLTTDTSQSTGTYSAGKVHGEVRRDILEADAKALDQTLRMQLLRPLVGFNFGWDKPVPYFDHNIEEDEDLKAVAETYKLLGEMGYPLTLEHVSDRFGVPLPEAGQTLLNKGQGSGVRGQENEDKEDLEGPEAQGGAEGAPDEDTEANRFTVPLRDGQTMPVTRHDKPVIQAQEDLQLLVDRALAASSRAVADLLRPVRRVIDAGGSLEEIRAGLLEVYPEMPAADLANALHEALVLASLRGRLDDAR